MRLLEAWVATPLAQAVGWTLFHSLWEGMVIAAALAAALVGIRPARARYAAAWVAMLVMLGGIGFTLVGVMPPGMHGRSSVGSSVFTAWNVRTDVDGASPSNLGLAAIVPWLAPFWFAGVWAFAVGHVAGWISVCRLRRRGVCCAPERWQNDLVRLSALLRLTRPILLLESCLAEVPMVVGHIRPVILLPIGLLAGLPAGQVEAILLHELAHIRRYDYLVNVLQRSVECLLFYHPAVWWISRVIRSERENCCDDVAVATSGNVQEYAVALASLERNRWSGCKAAVAGTGGNLMKRIKRLLYPKAPSGIWAPALAAVVLMVSTAMVLAAWHVNPNSSPASEQTDRNVDNAWQKWLKEDAVYIISDQEKTAFEHLGTDEERQHFVEEFWARRNPTPGAPENEFKKEHYRRIAYANKHWAWNLPGWKTDRGRIYILHGPPDEIDSHPTGGSYMRPESEGGGSAMTCPFENWRYSHFEGIGSLSIEFVDPSSSGEYRMTLDPKEKYKKP